MSLRTKIQGAVNKAFAAAGDLVKQGTLSNRTVSDYNFGTGAVESSTIPVTVDIIILDKKKSSGTPFEYNAIIKSGPTLDAYDTVTVDRVVYSIVSYTDNDFAVDLVLKKEA